MSERDTLTFRLNIDTDNDAFQPDPRREIADILKHIATQVANGEMDVMRCYQTVFDVNGNDVGRYAFKRRGE